MRLSIIRHAQVAYRHGGSLASVPPEERSFLSDPALSETGRKQAALLAEHIKSKSLPAGRQQPLPHDRPGFAITRLYCSPMRRALQTAQPVAEALGVSPEIWLDLHELGGIRHDEGDGRGPRGFPGLTRAEVEAQFPGFVIPADFADSGWWNRPPEEEDAGLARLARVAQALRTLAESTDEHIAIITHGTAANYVLHALLGSTDQGRIHFSHNNTGITSVTFGDDETTIRYLNRVEHLPDELQT